MGKKFFIILDFLILVNKILVINKMKRKITLIINIRDKCNITLLKMKYVIDKKKEFT
jgi:hypothetical protein